MITEYAVDGQPRRSFGELRRTGHENDLNVHLALNSGLVVSNPAGGFYFVFLSGVPQFRKYDENGRLVFERHIEDAELDRFVQMLPTTWKRQKTEDGEIPLVLPSVLAAAADRRGNLWISTAVGVTFVYDGNGEKRRAVQFRAAGTLAPTAMSFTSGGRLLVTPGCYAFPGSLVQPETAPAQSRRSGESRGERRLAGEKPRDLGRTRYSQRVTLKTSPSVLTLISRASSMSTALA